MRISDWSSDVCSSDLIEILAGIDAADADLSGKGRAHLLLDQPGVELAHRRKRLIPFRAALFKLFARFRAARCKLFRAHNLHAREGSPCPRRVPVRPFRPVEKLNKDRKSTRLNSSH